MKIKDFFHRQFQVARVFGIPVRIDARWFVVFALSVWIISSNLQAGPLQLSQLKLPPLDPLPSWILALITTAALFFSIFGHELSHALVGRVEGIETEEIVLHPFGGLARLRTEPQSPGAEFRIAVAGPAASFIFSLLFFLGAVIANMAGYPTAVALFYLLAAGNLLLAVFNLFPGYPLDGGRVLRAIVWKTTGNMNEATRKAGLCGLVIAIFLVLFGLYVLSWPAVLMGLWSILIGLFLMDAAARVVKATRKGGLTTVSQVMRVPVPVDPSILVSQFVDTILPVHRQASFAVAKEGQLHGILSLEDLKSIPRERWPRTHVAEAMRPVAPELFVEQNEPLKRADELMRNNGVGALAVVNGSGKLVGFIQKGTLKKR